MEVVDAGRLSTWFAELTALIGHPASADDRASGSEHEIFAEGTPVAISDATIGRQGP
ncbi:MAG: hypothetical protein WCE62_00205 [Polyangiales bacterium]